MSAYACTALCGVHMCACARKRHYDIHVLPYRRHLFFILTSSDNVFRNYLNRTGVPFCVSFFESSEKP